MRLKPLIVILGPTASGKTDLAIQLAQKFNSEIISADARQIYREMDIGTAKPNSEELLAVPHHLVGSVNPDEEYNVADFKRDAISAARDILKHGKLPFLVGGTGLYISSVVDNLTIPRVPPNKKLRDEFENKSLEELNNLLKEKDLKTAKIIDLKNKRRIIRALEVIEITGKSFSEQQRRGPQIFEILQIGINLPREELYKRIDLRAEKMIESGLIDEVKGLLKKYPPNLKAFDAIGYKEIIGWIIGGGQEPLDKIVKRIQLNTHSYARRQLSWFRRDKRIKWVKNKNEASNLVECFLN